MAKKKEATPDGSVVRELFARAWNRRRSGLFLRRFVADEAEKIFHRSKERDNAYQILKHWADLEQKGYLAKKKPLDNGFLEKVFGDALGYRSHSENPEDYQLEVKFTVPGVGTADAALGNFRHGEELRPLVVMELKDAGATSIAIVSTAGRPSSSVGITSTPCPAATGASSAISSPSACITSKKERGLTKNCAQKSPR